MRFFLVNEFLEQFLIEGRELVEQATEDLLSLEESPDDQARFDSAFRAFHTLKGIAGIVEFGALTRVMHAAEGTLAAVRAGDQPITGELISDYLACLDQVEDWLASVQREERLPTVPNDTTDALVARLENSVAEAVSPAVAAAAEVQHWVGAFLARHPTLQGPAQVAVRYIPESDCFFRGEDPLALVAQIPELLAIELAGTRPWPPLDELDAFVCNLTLIVLAAGPADQVTELFRNASGTVDIQVLSENRSAEGRVALSAAAVTLLREQIALVALDDGGDFVGRLGSAARVCSGVLHHAGWLTEAARIQEAAQEGLKRGEAGPLAAVIREILARRTDEAAIDAVALQSRRRDETAVRSLRVGLDRIDALVKLAGELTVVKNAIGHISRLAKERSEVGVLAPLLVEQHASLDRLVQELQASLLGIRVLPMRHVFRRFPKMVRETAAELSKSVRLEIEGEATEGDKTVVEGLSEPLMHLLRNAIDHGIEDAPKRSAAGKTPIATIRLRAERQGEQIVVEVEDDGAGIDTARVRALAEASGIASPDALAGMSETEIIGLIFAPGLSTSTTVSKLSGRGVGMDVVRSTVERLGGRVEVASRAGGGTRVSLRVPFAVMISRVMTLDAGGQVFGVPMEAVVETVRVPRERIMRVGVAEAFVLRESTMPLVNLAGVLGLRDQLREAPQANLVVTATEGQLAALEVDSFGEHMEVMLNPLEGLLAGVRGVAGTTLLGDGRVLIVLDMQDLLQ